MKKFLFVMILMISLVSAAPTLHTPQVITASGTTTADVSFFNDGSTDTFTGALSGDFVSLDYGQIEVTENSYGSMSLNFVGDLATGVYFGSLHISNSDGPLFNVPIVYGKESPRPLPYDVSIQFDPDTYSFSTGELIISPKITIYKLDYNQPTANNIALKLFIYDLEGNLIDFSEEELVVSRQSTFTRFFNLADYPAEIVFVAEVEQSGELGLDLAQVSLPAGDPYLSPIEEKDYSSWIYLGVVILLLGGLIGLSYFWNHHSMMQAKDWKNQINHIKKTQFSDAGKSMRKLTAQREVLERAYHSHYISKESYNSAINEIEKMSQSLKKRL